MDLASNDHLLTTTRSVRKRLDFDRPVERSIIEECIRISLQAPTGSNMQAWRFVVVDDPALKEKVADCYRRGFASYRSGSKPDDPTGRRDQVASSADYLAENMHRAPVLLIPCYQGRVEKEGVLAQASFYGSILPAAWSFMLAARARGLGSAWTTLHLVHEAEAAAALGIPDDWTQTCLLPVAYFQGDDFKPAARLPVEQVTSWNGWTTA